MQKQKNNKKKKRKKKKKQEKHKKKKKKQKKRKEEEEEEEADVESKQNLQFETVLLRNELWRSRIEEQIDLTRLARRGGVD